MKCLIKFGLAVLPLLFFVSTLHAQGITADSGNGVIYQQIGITNPTFAEGPPDHQYAFIPASGFTILDMGFRRDVNSGLLPIVKGATLKIYSSKPAGVDSAAAQVQFIKLRADGSEEHSSIFYYADTGITTIISDSFYTYIEFNLTGGGTVTGSRGFNLDAITLFEDFGSISVAQEIKPQVAGLLGNYPNPFSTSSATNFKMHLNRAGSAELVVYDAIGREVSRNNMGYLSPGDFTTTFTATAPGVYFARLLLNGAPYGAMLKMTSIR